jgi:hypothetical protein
MQTKTATCKVTGSGFTKGRKYGVVKETEKTVTLINNDGEEVRKNKSSAFETSVVNMMICKTDTFSQLTKGNSYEVISELGGFYFVKNNKGKKAKYGTRHFMEPAPPKPRARPVAPRATAKPIEAPVAATLNTPKPVEAPKAKAGAGIKMKCLYSIPNKLTFKKEYVTIAKDEQSVTIIDDNGEEYKTLLIRFIEKG